MYYDGGDHMGAGGWVLMALIAVLLIGLLVAFVVWLMQDQRRRPHIGHYATGGSAAEILDRRLATGEISIQEYERLKATLATPPPSSGTEPPTAPQT
jgi:uncharacterized membrane protein